MDHLILIHSKNVCFDNISCPLVGGKNTKKTSTTKKTVPLILRVYFIEPALKYDFEVLSLYFLFNLVSLD